MSMNKKKYLYCITDNPKIDIIPCKGIKNFRPFLIRWEDIAIVASEIPNGTIELTTEAVLNHEEVVEYMMRNHTVLPMRFGTVVSSADEAKHILLSHKNSIYKNIEKIRGNVELGLKIILKDPPEELILETVDYIDEEISPGRRYLLEKLKQEERQRKILEDVSPAIDEIYQTLKKYAIESCVRKLATEKMLLNSSYLVPKEKIDEFKTSVEILKKKYSTLSLLYSGPWPAYNFVSLEQGGLNNVK